MEISPIVLSIPVYFLLIGIELLVQWWQKDPIYRLNDALTNISCGITQQVSDIFAKVAIVAIYEYLYTTFGLLSIAPTWYNLLILFVAIDFLYYWAHRKSHEVNLFWGGHVVHHQSEDYNFSVALRQGSFQTIWTFGFYLPLAIIGFDTASFVLMSALVTVYQFWIHTEKVGKLHPAIEFIMNTPSHHRVHHGRNPEYIDKNHAGVFIVWDRMFGTFTPEKERPVYGITTPINTWNPIWANVKHYAQMARTWGQIKGWGNKMRFLFNKPGWMPASMGGPVAVPNVNRKAYHKFNAHTTVAINWYVLAQYLCILAGTALYLFTHEGMPMGHKVLITLFIMWAVMNVGGLFENLAWVWRAEALRLPLTVVLVGYLTQWQSMALAATGLYAVAFGAWLFVLRQYKPVKQQSNAVAMNHTPS